MKRFKSCYNIQGSKLSSNFSNKDNIFSLFIVYIFSFLILNSVNGGAENNLHKLIICIKSSTVNIWQISYKCLDTIFAETRVRTSAFQFTSCVKKVWQISVIHRQLHKIHQSQFVFVRLIDQ